MRVVEKWYKNNVGRLQKSSDLICAEKNGIKHQPNHPRQVCMSLRSRDGRVNRPALQRVPPRDLMNSSGPGTR